MLGVYRKIYYVINLARLLANDMLMHLLIGLRNRFLHDQSPPASCSGWCLLRGYDRTRVRFGEQSKLHKHEGFFLCSQGARWGQTITFSTSTCVFTKRRHFGRTFKHTNIRSPNRSAPRSPRSTRCPPQTETRGITRDRRCSLALIIMF